jgi:hypothetical protein
MLTFTRNELGNYVTADGRFEIVRRTASYSGLRGSRGSARYVSFDLYDGGTKIEHRRKLAECKASAELAAITTPTTEA